MNKPRRTSTAANKPPDRHEIAAKGAVHALEALQQQAEQARMTLTGLQQDMVAAESRMDSNQATQLLEANQQLVLAALRAQSEAEAAAQALNEVSRSAGLDVLTELPNRVLLLDRFAQAIAMVKRSGARVAVLFLDLDNFKQINDKLGHAIGDKVLQVVAKRLSSSVREGDTVSRHGGDEFLILLPEVSDAADVVCIADKMIAALAAPSRVGDHVMRMAASVGISIYPDDGEDPETLISRADDAMYRAKRHGLGSFIFHSDEPPNEKHLAPAALASLKRPLTHYEMALLDYENRHAQLCEANGKLVLAALQAQNMQAAAEQAHQRQIKLLAAVAHELSMPLTPIRMATTMLRGISTEELPTVQAIIEQQVKHISRLVDDLLDVSRTTTGKLWLEPKRVEIIPIIDSAIDTCQPAMDVRLQHFTVQLSPGSMEVYGDSIRLAQIACNLLSNASKYTQIGGQIKLSVEPVDDEIVITVTDNGIGISAEFLPDVFKPFTQDAHAARFNTGLGIGLTVVQELVEAHAGTVVASSAGRGCGSRFLVTLPLAQSTDGR